MSDNSPTVFLPFQQSAVEGAGCEVGKTFTEADNSLFAGLSGNLHPLYLDHAFATKSGLRDRLVFELALASLCVTAAAELAGARMRLDKIDLHFARPVSLGGTIRASAVVSSRTKERVEFTAAAHCADDNEELAVGRLRFAVVGG